MYTQVMQHLQSVTKGILSRVEEITGKSIQFMRDDNLAVLSTLQMARHGAEFHVLRYRPSNDPIDYFVAFQAGFALRLFECDPSSRFDFLPDSDAGRRVDVLLKAGQALGATDLAARQALLHDPQTLFGLAAALESVGGEDNVDEADELYQVVIERWPASLVAEPARAARTALAHKNMRSKVGGGLRPDVMMYIASALETFAKLDVAKRQQVTLEIALKGQTGLDINDAEAKYTLKSLPGQFSGMHLVSIMYVGMKELDPDTDPGVDLSAEYDAAKLMQNKN